MASSIWPRSLASAAPLEAITAQATAMAVELFLKPINSRFIFISIQENQGIREPMVKNVEDLEMRPLHRQRILKNNQTNLLIVFDYFMRF